MNPTSLAGGQSGSAELSPPLQPSRTPAPRPSSGRLLIVFILALFFLSPRLWFPLERTFDEGFYVVAAEHILHGQGDNNFEHPPLGKYLIAAGMKCFGDAPGAWRIASVLFGSLLMVIVFAWMWEYGEATAWSAVILVAANGFWFCMSRCAMLPIFELTFTLLGLWMLSRRHYVPCGIALGLAAACRWNALFALLIALVWALARGDDAASGWVERVKNCLRLGTAAALAYVAGWLPETGLHPLRFIQAQLFIMHFHRFCSGNPAINARWYQWLYKTTPENGLYHMLANPVITIAGILAALVLLRRGNLVGIAGPVFLLQWAVTPRPFNYYYYYFDALTMFSLAAAIVGTRHSFRIAGRQVRLITPIAAVAVFWFVAHYASFLGLQSPYDTLFQLWP